MMRKIILILLFLTNPCRAETATIGVMLTVDNAAVFGLAKTGEPVIDAASDCRYFEEDGTIYKNC